MKPLVYIILVNYNGAKDTIECVESLEKINFKNYKIVIVDNNSTDDSFNIIESKCGDKHKVVKSVENNGFSAGNNIGIKVAIENGADYVLLLNNDTIVEKNFLSELIESVDSKTGIVIGKILYEDKRDLIWYDGGEINYTFGKVKHYNYNSKNTNKHLLTRDVTFATGCCMLIPKKALEKVGLLSEEYFLYYEDADYCARVINKGFSIKYNPNSIIYHKVSASTGKNSSLTQYYMVRNRFLFIKRNITGVNWYFANFYFCLQIVKYLLTGEVEIRNVKKAIRDFWKNF